jgi:hypothetical protein
VSDDRLQLGALSPRNTLIREAEGTADCRSRLGSTQSTL